MGMFGVDLQDMSMALDEEEVDKGRVVVLRRGEEAWAKPEGEVLVHGLRMRLSTIYVVVLQNNAKTKMELWDFSTTIFKEAISVLTSANWYVLTMMFTCTKYA